MTDAAAQPSAAPAHGSLAGASNRLRQRRRAQTRLKAYGIAAIAFALLALATLVGSVVVKATGALTNTHFTYEMTLSTEALGVTPESPPEEILRAPYGDLIDEALEARFPLATGRTARREVDALVSNGAQFQLAQHVVENPELLGQSVTYPLIASDRTDYYFQGGYGDLLTPEVAGRLTVTGSEDGTLDIRSSEEDFAEALQTVKQSLYGDADRLREQAARQQNAVRVYGERAAAAETEEAREAQLERQAQAEAKRDDLLAEAEALEERAAADAGTEPLDAENISLLIEAGGGWIKMTEVNRSGGEGVALTEVDLPIETSADWRFRTTTLPEGSRRVSDRQIAWLETLKAEGAVERDFNTRFFTAADSRAPELAGIRGALVGSFWTMMVTFALAFPIGVLAAIYLEEFAPKNRFTNFIEVNINNLAAVPSIVYGLLGLAVFINVFGVPRSAPLAGGLVLTLMTLPTIIIAARAAIKAVPPSIREAALGVGASKMQASFHHVLPLAMPGILTGTIIGMAQALGETAPLIMIGMVAFIVETPSGITDSATVLPVQIFRWYDFPEPGFEARAAAAICVLLTFLIAMNALAIFLRKRFERRW